MQVGAAEDAAKAPSLAIGEGEDGSRQAGRPERDPRSRRSGAAARRRRRPDLAEPEERRRRRRPRRDRRLPLDLPVRQLGDAADDAARAQFAAFATSLATALPTVHRFIVGNEPNLNRFWMPQFAADGSDVAAPAYEALLAQTYDALKGVAAASTVIGGALSPRGNDSVMSRKHSPTTFIADLGRAYRRSGRTRPIMDAFALHPYEDNSSIPPSFRHPHTTTISLADYPKLVRLLGEGVRRHGPARRDAADRLRRVRRPVADPGREAARVRRPEPRSDRPVTEATQAEYYAEALALAACQPTVEALLDLPRQRRAGPRPLAVRPLLRRRHAEDEPGDRRASDRVAPRRRRPRVHARRRAGLRGSLGRRLNAPATLRR